MNAKRWLKTGGLGLGLLLLGPGCEYYAEVSDSASPVIVAYDDGVLVAVGQRYVYDVGVMDVYGRPVPGAVVSLSLQGADGAAQVQTGVEGIATFEFDAAPGTPLYISVQSAWHLPSAVSDVAGDNGYQAYWVTLADY